MRLVRAISLFYVHQLSMTHENAGQILYVMIINRNTVPVDYHYIEQ